MTAEMVPDGWRSRKPGVKLVKFAAWWRGRGGGVVGGSGREKWWEEGQGRGRPPLQVES